MKQMNRQMEHNMQGMGSLFKDASSLLKPMLKPDSEARSRPAKGAPLPGMGSLFKTAKSAAVAAARSQPAKGAPLPHELDKVEAIVDGTSTDLSQDKSGLMNSAGLSKNSVRMDSSSDSSETSIATGHIVQKRKTCHNGKCNESVIEGDAKKAPGDTALSERRTEQSRSSTDAAMDAEGLRIRKRMKDMNRQMNRQMKNHMQAMDSFFKDASSFGR